MSVELYHVFRAYQEENIFHSRCLFDSQDAVFERNADFLAIDDLDRYFHCLLVGASDPYNDHVTKGCRRFKNRPRVFVKMSVRVHFFWSRASDFRFRNGTSDRQLRVKECMSPQCCEHGGSYGVQCRNH